MSLFHNASKRGFSLVELVAVIAVVSILAIATVPALVGQDEAALATAVQTLASDMRITRMSAVWGGSSRSVILTAGTGAYIYDSASGVGKTRDLAEIRRGIVVATQSVITFNSLGESGPTASTITLSLNGHSRIVTVAPFTAKINVQ
jgi:prepilin-type N-terminal cleavage/methylation domain-containing protein